MSICRLAFTGHTQRLRFLCTFAIRPTVHHGTLQMLRLLLPEVMPVSAGASAAAGAVFLYDHDQQHSLCTGAL